MKKDTLYDWVSNLPNIDKEYDVTVSELKLSDCLTKVNDNGNVHAIECYQITFDELKQLITDHPDYPFVVNGISK